MGQHGAQVYDLGAVVAGNEEIFSSGSDPRAQTCNRGRGEPGGDRAADLGVFWWMEEDDAVAELHVRR